MAVATTDDHTAKSRRRHPAKSRANSIRIHYIKSNHFRVVHADGIWGGLTPNLGVHMAVFSERSAIPQQVVYQLAADGSLGEEMPAERVTKEGLIREVEVELLMSLPVAKAVMGWLQEKVTVAEQIIASKQGEKE